MNTQVDQQAQQNNFSQSNGSVRSRSSTRQAKQDKLKQRKVERQVNQLQNQVQEQDQFTKRQLNDNNVNELQANVKQLSETIQNAMEDVKPKSCTASVPTLYEAIPLMFAIMFFSFVGVIVRFYSQKLALLNGFPTFTALFPQMIGSFIMGIVTTHKKLLSIRHKTLYTGLVTGLCGSITTYSTWQCAATKVIVGYPGSDIEGASARFWTWFTIIVIGIVAPYGTFIFGHDISKISPWNDDERQNIEADNVQRKEYCLFDYIMIGIGFLGLMLAILVPFSYEGWEYFTFGLLFGASGSLLRYFFSWMNVNNTKWPIGTFCVNIFGSFLLGGMYVIKSQNPDLPYMHMEVLKGAMLGFAGCFTTVSSFVAELEGMEVKHQHMYTIFLLFVSQAGLACIMGPYAAANN